MLIATAFKQFRPSSRRHENRHAIALWRREESGRSFFAVFDRAALFAVYVIIAFGAEAAGARGFFTFRRLRFFLFLACICSRLERRHDCSFFRSTLFFFYSYVYALLWGFHSAIAVLVVLFYIEVLFLARSIHNVEIIEIMALRVVL